jgi:hypothetical protein
MDAANPLTTTLLILYFVGTPPSDPAGIPKPEQEKKINWTLQSTSQIETPSPEACFAIGNQIITKIDKVNTMTVRAYCLCADGDGKICKDAEGSNIMSLNPRERTPTVEAIGRQPRSSSRNNPGGRDR